MTEAIAAAVRFGCDVGAHPAYPDRAGFGRRTIEMTGQALHASLVEQLSGFSRLCDAAGVPVVAVKAHGALYHDASAVPRVAAAIASAVDRVCPAAALVAFAGSGVERDWRTHGRAVWSEAFVDRVYESAAVLRSREQDGAMITDAERAAAQAISIASRRTVMASDSRVHTVRADVLCVHGDSPNAVVIARRVRAALDGAGVSVREAR
jgi:UPF0271 protein